MLVVVLGRTTIEEPFRCPAVIVVVASRVPCFFLSAQLCVSRAENMAASNMVVSVRETANQGVLSIKQHNKQPRNLLTSCGGGCSSDFNAALRTA